MSADWDHLKVVLAIWRTGSLTAAAQQLGMDQTTAGRRLNALENQLNNHLFIRAKSGFVPTEPGQIVIESARKIEARLSEMLDNLAETQSDASGILRIMGNTWMLQRLAEAFLPEILNANPNLEIRMSGRLPPAPLYSEPTISLWFDAAPHPPDHAIPLCRVPYAAYKSKTAAENSNWIQFQDDLAQGPSFSRQVRKRLDVDARIRLTATDAQILQGAARSGMGQSVLPICLGDADDVLIRATGQLDAIDRVLHLHVSSDAYRTRRVRMLISALQKTAAELFGGTTLLKTETLDI